MPSSALRLPEGKLRSARHREDASPTHRSFHPGWEEYWTAVLEDPEASLPLSGKPATPKEIEYATWASRRPHIVVSRKPMDVAWSNSRVAPDLERSGS